MAAADMVLIVYGDGGLARRLARRVRELNVYCELAPSGQAAACAESRPPRGVIVAGDGVEAPAGLPVLRMAGDDGDDEALRRFLFDECGCSATWTTESFIEQAVAQVRAQVGQGRVVAALSGGVDSAVAAALVHRAVGAQLTCIFVDHGLLRKGEAEQVIAAFREQFQAQLVFVDARQRFLDALAGVADPERKRKIIGELFIRIFEEEARRLGDARYLVQGTVYSDVIESGAEAGHGVVKSHHNVGGLPERMDLELVEPLRDLFKDEVRRVGLALGLPEAMVWRHPFPGPGLAVRVVGEVTAERLDVLREADAIVREEIQRAGLQRELFQAFAVLSDTRTVGVSGGARTYGAMVAVRAVQSAEGMEAQWARLPYEVLDRISQRILREVPGVNRVVYDISSKPPATIEWE